MSKCTQSMCRGGLACCYEDQDAGLAYCTMQSYCNSNSQTWQHLFLLLFLLVATLGVLLVVWCRYKSINPSMLTHVNFVERQVRLQPQLRYEHTKLKTLTSFD